MRESLAAHYRLHDRCANVIRYQRSGVTKSPRSDMFRLKSAFAVDVKLADDRDGSRASSKDLRPMRAIKRARIRSCRSDSKRFSS